MPPSTAVSAVSLTGTAYGAFLKYMQEQGYTKLTGLDLSRPAVEHMKHDMKIDAICADLADANLPADCWDVVTLLDTLEHLPHFHSIVKECAFILKPGGGLIIRVPNMNFHLLKLHLFQLVQLRSPYGMFTPPGHLNHFMPSGLRRLLQSSGFDCRGFYNGAIDRNGNISRVLALQTVRAAAETVRWIGGQEALYGNSMVVYAVKTESRP